MEENVAEMLITLTIQNGSSFKEYQQDFTNSKQNEQYRLEERLDISGL